MMIVVKTKKQNKKDKATKKCEIKRRFMFEKYIDCRLMMKSY